jgi:hypothetical protein
MKGISLWNQLASVHLPGVSRACYPVVLTRADISSVLFLDRGFCQQQARSKSEFYAG